MAVTINNTLDDFSTISGSSNCAEYQAVYDEMDTLGNPPDSTNAGYQNTMVAALVSGGYWARMDLFYCFATQYNEAGQALLNWIDPGTYDCTLFNEPTWTALEGYTGLEGYENLETGFVPSTNATHYALDDAGFGVYVRTNLDSPNPIWGSYQTSTIRAQLSLYNLGGSSIYLNTGDYTSSNQANTSGFWQGSRTASDAFEMYRNGASIATEASVSTSVPSGELIILSGAYQGISSLNQVSIFMLMDSFDDTEADAIYDIIQAYMTSIGKQV